MHYAPQRPIPITAKLPSAHPLRIDSNDKSSCQGIGAFITRCRHCLIALPWTKIVDIAMLKFNSEEIANHEEGAFERCTCTRARCTPPLCVVHHRKTLIELYRCTKNFHVACSNFIEVRGHPMCTCVARAHCTTTPQVMHHRKVRVELYQCTKFRVASLKFPESKGAHAYV